MSKRTFPSVFISRDSGGGGGANSTTAKAPSRGFSAARGATQKETKKEKRLATGEKTQQTGARNE